MMLPTLTNYYSLQSVPVTTDRFLHLELSYVPTALPRTTGSTAVGPHMIGWCVCSKAVLDVVGHVVPPWNRSALFCFPELSLVPQCMIYVGLVPQRGLCMICKH